MDTRRREGRGGERERKAARKGGRSARVEVHTRGGGKGVEGRDRKRERQKKRVRRKGRGGEEGREGWGFEEEGVAGGGHGLWENQVVKWAGMKDMENTRTSER